MNVKVSLRNGSARASCGVGSYHCQKHPLLLPFPLQIFELLAVFGTFLLILMGVELLRTMNAYLKEHFIDVKILVEVALIAIARKVTSSTSRNYPVWL